MKKYVLSYIAAGGDNGTKVKRYFCGTIAGTLSGVPLYLDSSKIEKATIFISKKAARSIAKKHGFKIEVIKL